MTTNNMPTDNHPLAINTIPNCVTNHENQKITHSAKKKIPGNNPSMINSDKQTVARSMETNNFNNNFDQQKITNTMFQLPNIHLLLILYPIA